MNLVSQERLLPFFHGHKQLKGRIGTGQVGVTSYIIPNGSIEFWENRLKKFGVEFTSSVRFGEKYLKFQDPDGLEVELVERRGRTNQSLELWRNCDQRLRLKGLAVLL